MMVRTRTLVGGLAALAIALAAMATASRANPQVGSGMQAGPGMMGPGMMGCGPGMMGWGPGATGWGMMGPGMMGPGMMGPGMMGPGMMGPGMMGPDMMNWGWNPNVTPANLNLSVDDVRGSLQRWIAIVGNPRLKVGNVAEKDADTITADIVTTDEEALVQRFDIDRRTGMYRPVE